uniref:Uso1_p115_head domain-containing protein n=1 Tax=Rhabditophanes sp. KR3021 TaxID=114890 RepID=A0AC35TSR2_9BILA
MSYFQNFFTGNKEAIEDDDDVSLVEKLFDRVESSTIYEDRRDALLTIKDMAPTMRSHVGSIGLKCFMDVLVQDQESCELIYIVFDIMESVLTVEDSISPKEDDLGDQLAELFVKKPALMEAIMNTTESFDFMVRKSLVQLLIALLRYRASEVQSAIINHHNGIGKIVDLLQDQREVIRNSVVLMLSELSKGNGNVQQLLVYENSFQILFGIIIEEMSESIVIEDCLFVILNLLKRNTGNQRYFRADVNLPNLLNNVITRLFFPEDELEETYNPNFEWPKQRISNIFFSLEVVRALVSSENLYENYNSCQKIFYQNGMLQTLSRVIFSELGAGLETVVQTIVTVGELIKGNFTNQDFFINTHVNQDEVDTSSLAVLMDALTTDKQPFKLRCAALYAFFCYTYDNEIGSNNLVKTLDPQRAANTPEIAGVGNSIIRCLNSTEPFQVWAGSVCLMHLIMANEDVKIVMLNIKQPHKDGKISLLEFVCNLLISQAKRKNQAKVGFLMLISVWITDCPEALNIFMKDPNFVQYITSEFIDTDVGDSETEDVIVRGMLGYVMMVAHANSATEDEKKKIFELINRRLGKSAVAESLENLTHSEYYLRSANKAQFNPKSDSSPFLDYQFCKIYRMNEMSFLKLLKAGNENYDVTNSAQQGAVYGYIELIRKQDEEIGNLKVELLDHKAKLEEITKKYINLEETSVKEITELKKTKEILEVEASEKDAYKSQVEILSTNVSLWQSEVAKYKQWSDQWQTYQLSQLPNPHDTVVQQLNYQVQQLDQQLTAGYQAFEVQSKALNDAVLEIQRKEEEINRLKSKMNNTSDTDSFATKSNFNESLEQDIQKISINGH